MGGDADAEMMDYGADTMKMVEKIHNIKFLRKVTGDDVWSRDVLTIFEVIALLSTRAT